jgi:hypothetical protein
MGMGNNQTGNQTPGLGMSTTFSDEEKKKKEQESLEKPQIPQLKSSSSQVGVAPTTAPKAAPKQQAAGTGTFSNLKSYIQAAQGGGQQKIAQAATQKVQNVASGAQKEISQSQKTFGNQLEAGTLANRGAAGGDVQAAIDAARGTVYQAPIEPVPVVPEVPTTPSETVVTTPTAPTPITAEQAGPSAEQMQRFQDIINARYAGPGSIQEAGLYNRAAEKARTAQEAVKQTQTAAGREQLLRNIFSQGRDYSRGQSKLDSLLLNTSQQGIGQLQQQAQQAGDLQQKLQQAQTESANTATGRATEISNIQQEAKKKFLEGRTEEETDTNAYIKNIQDNWSKLPDYFKDLLTQTQTQTEGRVGNVAKSGWGANANAFYDNRLAPNTKGNTYNLSAEETAILGLTPGQGLFGIDPTVMEASPLASKGELITKNQLARQLALNKLANLDKSNQLRKELEYSDLEKAGTKNILDSLNTQKLKDIQTENKKNFEKDVQGLRDAAIYSGGQGGRYNAYSAFDILKSGGYTPTTSDGFLAEDNTKNLLTKIAQNSEYSPAEITPKKKDYIQKAFESEKYFKNTDFNANQLTSGVLNPLQKLLSTYGGSDTVQTVENENTKARGEALRKLIGNIYKNE